MVSRNDVEGLDRLVAAIEDAGFSVDEIIHAEHEFDRFEVELAVSAHIGGTNDH